MAEQNFDLIIIGAGPAGYVAAIRAAQLGMKVACVDKRKELGGTCLNVGCIPSKALLDSSEHFAHARKGLEKHGVIVNDVRIDLATMMKRKDAVVKSNTGGIDFLFKKNKIEKITGAAKITSTGKTNTVEVTTIEGTLKLSAGKVIVATGSAPAELPFMKFDGKRILSSTEALTLGEIPKHLIVVGAGAIGLEMGSVWLRLGAKVTVVEFLDRIVPAMDGQAGKELQRSLEKQGFQFKLSTQCLGARVEGAQVTVEVEDRNTKSKDKIVGDYVLVSTGRRPYTENLGLEQLNVAKDERGFIKIDAHYQTNVAGIYAIGDCVPGPMLAHKGEEEGVAAVELMAGQKGHVNYKVIPNIVYTWPEVAGVGETEEELKKRGVEFKSGSFPFSANGRARAMEETEGFAKVLADARTDRILGVHIFGPRASDMIAEAAAVMEFGGSAEDLARTCHAHPTLSEALKEAALGVANRRIHL